MTLAHASRKLQGRILVAIKGKNMSKKTDLFGDELSDNSGQDFESMFRDSMARAGDRLRNGDMLKGEILSIGKESAFVSTGTPIDGLLPTAELKDKNGALLYKVGDSIEVKVVRTRENEVLLKRADSLGSSDDAESLEDAFDMELPVRGKVSEAVKGGFRVEIQGQRAFCPLSQIDLRASNDPNDYVGKSFDFIITKFEKRDMVVSRRRILELQRAEGEGAFLLARKPGEILEGEITRIERYGAFCRLTDGVEGLIPISEMAWGRINDPHEVVSLGQKVSVMLMKAEEDGDRLKVSLSLKQGGGVSDPWQTVTQKFPLGSQHEGVVDRKEVYGLFVNLGGGITGLLPRSKWRDHLEAKSYENKKKGESIKVMVDEMDLEARKLTLAPPGDRDDGAWRAHMAPKKGMGTFADLLQAAKPQSSKKS